MDSQKALNVKREALLDLVYSYTEARPPKGALPYFEKLSDSRTTYALALDKLGNRYFIKQQYEWAIPALRKLMEIQPDPDLDLERAEKLYDSLKAAKGRVPTQPEDIKFLVRAAVNVKVDPFKDETTRRKQLVELEELTRDLATQLQALAQKTDDRKVYLQAASAYKEYLSLFRPEKYVRDIMHNRADALFAAHAYPEAARQFEELEAYETRAKNAAGAEAAAYGALLSPLQRPEGRRGGQDHRLRGGGRPPGAEARRSEVHRQVPAQPERAHRQVQHRPRLLRRRRVRAVEPALHRLRHGVPDAEGRAGGGQAGPGQPPPAQRLQGHRGDHPQVPLQLAAACRPSWPRSASSRRESKGEALGELALQSSAETGDVVEGLLKVASENKGGDIAEKALYGAFTAAREKKDFAKEREIGAKLLTDYPKTAYTSDVLATLARHSAEAGRFPEAAQWYEQLGARMGQDGTAYDGLDGGRPAADGAQRPPRRAEGLPGRGQRGRQPPRRGAGAARPGQAQGARPGRGQGQRPRRRSAVDKTNPQAAAVLAEVAAARASGPTCWPRRSPRW